jgi:hypothetical protein
LGGWVGRKGGRYKGRKKMRRETGNNHLIFNTE